MDEIFKALSDPTRIRMVEILAERGEVCVCKIMEELELGQSVASHHLAILRRSGIVMSRRDGQWIHYSLNPDALKDGPIQFLNTLWEKASHSSSVTNAHSCKC